MRRRKGAVPAYIRESILFRALTTDPKAPLPYRTIRPRARMIKKTKILEGHLLTTPTPPNPPSTDSPALSVAAVAVVAVGNTPPPASHSSQWASSHLQIPARRPFLIYTGGKRTVDWNNRTSSSRRSSGDAQRRLREVRQQREARHMRLLRREEHGQRHAVQGGRRNRGFQTHINIRRNGTQRRKNGRLTRP